MAEFESAAGFSSRLLNNIIDHAHLSGADYLMALQLIQARDAAVAARAKREVLGELRRNYWGNRDTSWEAEAQKLLAALPSGEKEPDNK